MEEARLTRTIGADPTPVPARLIRAGGLDGLVGAFEASLCHLPNRRAAEVAVDVQGRLLWEAAVARGEDDRPLYWARLTLTRALRQWTPRFAVSHPDLENRLERASRGITSSDFVPGARKLFVSGFDPFLLDTEIRRSNPSGVNALALDGKWITVDGEPVQIQTAMFPVRYADFDHGVVEDAFRAHLAPGTQRADLVVTVSQGRPGQFDLEVNNGRRRSVSSIGDNDNVWGGGSLTAPLTFPGVGPGAEFVPTSLPVDAMRAATGRFPVLVNRSVTEIPAGGTAPVFRPDGPTPGSVAVNGGGGGYLSNEIAYRATRLRVELGAPVAGGHVHTPVLDFGAGNTTELTDPVFEANRSDMTAQLLLILRAGISARVAIAQ
ncbi:hypothetical protein R8Z50_07325 [Longispora sp. K20-0274]|uniref:hypothetical protein n=1 Tax=Longispora sp. K20-0274 TaxID=3088255 RepID=UPI00399A5CDB